ncbi:MAG: SUMF1/EgtB/PvdO family nonheme iron enzyme [Spirochaetales bacterium]|nr:SUMF1/EgtB/PvdO family nonheme iron enzyme [Spirochaetales bacterium]
MKLKKIFLVMLSILFVAALSAQTKEVHTNKLIKTLEKNKKTGVTFVSDINLNGIEVLENQTLVIPSLKNETINFVAKIETEFLIERIKYKNSQLFKVEFVLQNENTKTYEITKIHNIETVKEYNTRIEKERIEEEKRLAAERQANLQKLPVQVINYEITSLNISESSWLPSQIQDKFKSNLQSYLGMKTVVDSKAEASLKKLQAESENVGRDENTAIELGKIISAKFALFTKIRKVGANYVIAVDFTDLTTGEQMASCMSKEYSNAEYLYGNTGAVDELTLALAEKLGIKVSNLNKNYLTSGSASFSVDEQLALAKENEAKYNKMMANYDAELAKLTTSNDINAIQNKKRIEAEKALLQEKQNAEKNRQAELQAQKERAEADKKLEAERSIALKTQRDKLAQDAAAKASEVRKLKMEKQGVLGQINVIESKKKALVEIRQGVENRSIELYNQLQTDIKSEFERITNKSYSTVELGSDGKPTEQALTRRESQRIVKYDELHKNFFADCESVKQATMSQQNALLQEIKQDQTNLTKPRTVSSMGDELKVSFGPYEGSKNGWNSYLSLYSDGILVYTDTVIVSYEAVAGKKAPNMETELNDAVIEEYTNNVDMYNSLLTRGDPILYFVLEYSVNAKSEDNPSEYDFTYKNLKVYNTLSDKVVQNIALNKTESKVMNPKQDLKIYDGIVENAKENVKTVKKYLENSWKSDKILSSIITYKSLQFVDIFGDRIKMLKTEVTQELYEIVMGENPSYFQGTKYLPAEGENQSKRPVENVSWYDAIYFCNKLSVIFGLDPVYSVDGETDVAKWNYVPHNLDVIKGTIRWEIANGFRLPTEREWRYAAKGREDFDYAGSNNIDEVAWYEKNSNFITHEVGKKKANGYGLFDMSGNVYEWCWSNFGNGLYCGGSWSNDDDHCEVDYSNFHNESYQYNDVGFRIVCSR